MHRRRPHPLALTLLALSVAALLATSQPGPPRIVVQVPVTVVTGSAAGSAERSVRIPVEDGPSDGPFAVEATLFGKWADEGKVTAFVAGQRVADGSLYGACDAKECRVTVTLDVALDAPLPRTQDVVVVLIVSVPEDLAEVHAFGGLTEVPPPQPEPEPS